MPLTRVLVGLHLVAAEVAHQAAGGVGVASESCRCAVLYSGHVRSFVQPGVHISHKKNLIEQLERDCHVDVFMYLSVEDEVPLRYRKGDFEDVLAFTAHTPQETDVEHAVRLLNPILIKHHQEQAGFIPNGCNTSCEVNAYWQLYKMRAVYKMMEGHEAATGLPYTWVVRSRLDIAWMLPLPPLSRFPPTRVYAGHNFFPLADQFLLVPRPFAQTVFGAVSLCYDCRVLEAHRESKLRAQTEGLLRMAMRGDHGDGVVVPFGYYEFPVVIVRNNEGGVCDVLHPHKFACEMLRASGLIIPLTKIDGGDDFPCTDIMNRWYRQACREMLPPRDQTAVGGDKDNGGLVGRESGVGREGRVDVGGRNGGRDGEDKQRDNFPTAARSKVIGEARATAAGGSVADILSFEEATRRVEGVNVQLSDLLGTMRVRAAPQRDRREYFVAHHYPFHHANSLHPADRGPLDQIATIEGYRLSQEDLNWLMLSFSCLLADTTADIFGKEDNRASSGGTIISGIIGEAGARETVSSQIHDLGGTGSNGGGTEGNILVLKTTAALEEGLQAVVNCSLVEPFHDVWVSLLDNKFELSEEICRGPTGPCLHRATPKGTSVV